MTAAAAAPYRTRLRYLRHITLWTLLLFVVVVFGSLAMELLQHRSAPMPALLVLVAAVVGACAVSAHFMIASVAPGGPAAMTRWVWIAFALGAAGALAAPIVSTWLYPPAQLLPSPWVLLPGLLTSAAVAGSGLPRSATAVAGTTLTVAACATGAAMVGHEMLPAVLGGAVAAGVASGSVAVQVWFWDVAAQVDRARQAENEAAVAGERLRFAAELHDIQGHSLQVIALKSELAARLVGADPSRAVAEMREIEALARQALRDTRDVAHGYRTVSLTTEIANATRVLAAAGVRCATRQDDDPPALPPATERLLGLVVREATTNVIRHSRAATAEISLTRHDGGVRLLVSNDAPLPPDRVATGGGLAGLAERFAAAGGKLGWQQGDNTFTVTAEVAPR
jgi:two-component system, NarL family, sensor histidine kinase DesK